MQISNRQKSMQIIIAIMGWVVLLLQFYLIIINRAASVSETIIRYFSYFTILTNILVAVAFTLLFTNGSSKWKLFFSKAPVFTAVTVYILVVGIIYNLVLRWLWQPEGFQKLADELLHSIIPIAVLIYWFLFVASSALRWQSVFQWLLYPFIYCLYILLRGAASGFYPYPFMDVNQLGYSKVLVNCFFVTITFLLISLMLIGIGKLLKKGIR